MSGVPVIDTGVDPRALAATLYRASGPAADGAAVAEQPSPRSTPLSGETRYDVVHNHAFDAPAIRLATGLPAPVVHTLHLPPDAAVADALRDAARSDRAPAVAGVSACQASAWRRVVSVDAILSPFVPTRAIRWSPSAGEGAVFAGRLSPEKGAVEAIEIARAAGVRIDLYGDVYDAEYTRERIDPRRADPGVAVHPGVPRTVIWETIARAAVVLCPARWEEPFGMVAAEAQACGTPVVAFRRGALDEVIVDGVTGFLVAPDDIVAAADAVSEDGRALALAMPRSRRAPPRSGAESRCARTALRTSGQSWRRGRSEWLRRGIGSRDAWRSSPAPAAGSAQPRPRRSRRRARTSCLAARDRDALDAVATRIRDAGGEATPVPTDVSSVTDVERLFDAVEEDGAARCPRLRGRGADVRRG